MRAACGGIFCMVWRRRTAGTRAMCRARTMWSRLHAWPTPTASSPNGRRGMRRCARHECFVPLWTVWTGSMHVHSPLVWRRRSTPSAVALLQKAVCFLARRTAGRRARLFLAASGKGVHAELGVLPSATRFPCFLDRINDLRACRLAIARALVRRPSVLLLDEVRLCTPASITMLCVWWCVRCQTFRQYGVGS